MEGLLGLGSEKKGSGKMGGGELSVGSMRSTLQRGYWCLPRVC